MPAMFAHIAVGLPVEGHFDYLVPPALQNRIAIGDRVQVNFAHAKRLGFVVGLANESAFEKVKPIEAVLDNKPLLSISSLRCASELSRYYGCSLGEAIEVMLPVDARKPKTITCHPFVPKDSAPAKGEGTLIQTQSMSAHWPLVSERIATTLRDGRGVIVLVPDTSQIPFVMGQLKQALPANAVIHDNERTHKQELENWIALKEGKTRAVVGLRTAAFAPVVQLGLIVVYDEDNGSYQEEQAPYYHARHVALMRSAIERCDVVFVSAAPSVELMHFAQKKNFARLSMGPESALRKQLIDMTNFTSKGPMTISFPLRNSLEKTLAEGGRSLVFINRRGFNTFTHCLFCGHILRCERCESNLVYLSSKRKFECRRCATQRDPVKLCPKCGKDHLRSQGIGVERVVSELKRIFPSARVEGFDKETAAFPKKCDILVATQAVFRMLGEVAFDGVGVLEIDAEFNRGDYRSSQHAFSIVAHLALLARKRLEIQTFHADNNVLRDFVADRSAQFYEQELKLRQDLKLPPFYHLVKIMLRGATQKVVCDQAELLYNLMAEQKTEGIDLLSIQPDAVVKVRDKFRYFILIRGENRQATLVFAKESLAKVKKKSGVIVTVQVDS
jgi:primosomal protein N' (replication factor Y) (superfamily II helicase)